MATFDINTTVSFTYSYGEENGDNLVEGNFFSRSDNSTLGIALKVRRRTREEAVDTIHRLAKLIGDDIAM